MDFRSVLAEALSPLEIAAQEKLIRFRVNVIGDVFQVIGDRRMLKQVVYELVNNAIKFTGQGGEIFISCWTSAHALCFDVQDSGVGIPAEKLNLVWNSFNQLQSDPVLRGVEGLGLGLALVRYIIKAHGGFAWVESEPGHGSVFGFQTPLRGPRHPLDPATAPRRTALTMLA
jgi:signal transduction histidine kinase